MRYNCIKHLLRMLILYTIRIRKLKDMRIVKFYTNLLMWSIGKLVKNVENL
jgi:hypothetical protein